MNGSWKEKSNPNWDRLGWGFVFWMRKRQRRTEMNILIDREWTGTRATTKKKHEEKERKWKFGQTRVENMNFGKKCRASPLHPWRWLTAWSTCWFTFMTLCASRHELSAVLWSADLYFTSPSSSLYLPLYRTAENLSGIALWEPGEHEQLDVFFPLFPYAASCAKVFVLCIRGNFASRLLVS